MGCGASPTRTPTRLLQLKLPPSSRVWTSAFAHRNPPRSLWLQHIHRMCCLTRRAHTAVHSNRVWVSHPYCHSERSEESSVAKCGLCLDSSTLLGMTMGRMQLNRGGCHAILPIKLQYQALLSNTRLFPSKSIFTLSPDEISALISFSLSLSSTSLWSVLLNGLAPYSAS